MAESPPNESNTGASTAPPKNHQAKLLYFRRRRFETSPFLVHVINAREEYCSNFSELNDALDFMEKIEETDAGTDCHLFQLIPMEDSDGL